MAGRKKQPPRRRSKSSAHDPPENAVIESPEDFDRILRGIVHVLPKQRASPKRSKKRRG